MKQVQEFVQQVVQRRRLMASAALALLAISICAHVVFGNNGWMAYRQKKAEYQKLQQDLKRLDDENHQLDSDIKALKSDPKAIEKEAREQLRYAKPGEVIYLLPEQPGQSQTNQTPAKNETAHK